MSMRFIMRRPSPQPLLLGCGTCHGWFYSLTQQQQCAECRLVQP